MKGNVEKEKWATIDTSYMTEESEAEDGGSIMQHHTPWRSRGMSRLYAWLCAVYVTVLEKTDHLALMQFVQYGPK